MNQKIYLFYMETVERGSCLDILKLTLGHKKHFFICLTNNFFVSYTGPSS